MGDLMGKALWKLVENAQRFPRRGDKELARRKGGDREVPSEGSAEAKPRPDGQEPNMRQSGLDERARVREVPYPPQTQAVDSAGVR